MKEMKTGVFTYNDESQNFSFSTSLSAYEKMIFVKTVVENLVDDDGYDVVIRDLIFDFAIVETFTNIDTGFINMKDEDDKVINPIILIEHFLDESDVVDVVKANMEDGLLDELNRAIDLNIQYLTGIQPNSLNDVVASLVSTIESRIKENDLKSVMGMMQKFVGTTEKFSLKNMVDAYINSDAYNKILNDTGEDKSEKVSADDTLEKEIKVIKGGKKSKK